MFVKVGVLVLLFLLNLLMNQAAASWGTTALSVGKILLDSFTSEDIKETDLTAAEELVRGFTFDKYNEQISCKILTKIKLEDFETLVSRIVTRYQIPVDIKERILDGQYAEANQEIVQEFKFEKGAPGSVLYGRIATLKHEDSTIDLAYVFFFLEFKLSPKKIEERRRKKFLFITYGSHTVVRFEERNLSEKDKEHISDFYRIKALKGFKKEFPALGKEHSEL